MLAATLHASEVGARAAGEGSGDTIVITNTNILLPPFDTINILLQPFDTMILLLLPFMIVLFLFFTSVLLFFSFFCLPFFLLLLFGGVCQVPGLRGLGASGFPRLGCC